MLIQSNMFHHVKKLIVSGIKYMFAFIDYFYKYVGTQLLKEKSKIFSKFNEFKKVVERAIG